MSGQDSFDGSFALPYPWAWVLVAVAGSILLRISFGCISHYRRVQKRVLMYMKKASQSHRNSTVHGITGLFNNSSYSLSGNLVKEHQMPITDHYELTNLLLGRGSSAEVVIGKHLKTHRRYAVKVIDNSRRDVAWRYEREMSILKDCDHTNIVRLFELYSTPLNRYFVMDLCTGGHLGYALKQRPNGVFDEETAKQFVLQIIHAIAHCHSRGICHRDVKLQNILLESNTPDAQLKIIDFGNACRFFGNCPMTKIVGTTYTAAPEVFKESYDERCDVWSIGVVAYILLCGHRPFESTNADANNAKSRETSIVTNILMGRYHFEHESWNGVSSSAVHFIQCCLQVDYTKRLSALGLLNHHWLTHSGGELNLQAGSRLTTIGARKLSRRLSRNLSSSDLRRASMIAVAFDLPAQKLQIYREIFQQIDQSGNGVLDRKEFQAAMETADPTMPKDDITLLFDTIDQDGNGDISFTEFVAATVDPREVNMAEINTAFRLFDKDGKGCITKEDLQRVLLTSWAVELEDGTGDDEDFEEIRQQKVNARIASIFEQSDVNKDGVISYSEFLFAMADGSSKQNIQSQRDHESFGGPALGHGNGQGQIHGTNTSMDSTNQSFVTGLSDFSSDQQPVGEKQHSSIPPPAVSQKRQQRRQSDSLLSLSRKSFRQRASSIIFVGPRASGIKDAATASSSASAVENDSDVHPRPSLLRRMSIALTAGMLKDSDPTLPNDQNPRSSVPLRVPSLATLMINDMISTIGINTGVKSVIHEDLMRSYRRKALQPVENLEDSPLDEVDSDIEDESTSHYPAHRRMSAPGKLWHSIKRRASIFTGAALVSPLPASGVENPGDIEAPTSYRSSGTEKAEAEISLSSRRKSVIKSQEPELAAGSRRKSLVKTVISSTSNSPGATEADLTSDIGAYKVDEGNVLQDGDGAPLPISALNLGAEEQEEEQSSPVSPKSFIQAASPRTNLPRALSNASVDSQHSRDDPRMVFGGGGSPRSPSSTTSLSRRANGTIQRVDLASPVAAAKALQAITNRSSGVGDDADVSEGADLSQGNSDTHGGNSLREGSDKPKIPGKQIKAPAPKDTRDSFTSAGNSTNSFDGDNNSFTNDSSHSDADRLKELVRFLRIQAQQTQPINASAGMETIREDDERRMSVQHDAGMIASLSNAFIAGMAAARNSMLGANFTSISNLTTTNPNQTDEDQMQNGEFVAKPAAGRSGRRFSHS